VIHGLSAASAGAIATLATHPFDVIKVGCFWLPSLLSDGDFWFLI
jgi:solute carrier family 25 protein 38